MAPQQQKSALATTARFFRRADTGPVAILAVGAVFLAGAHLTKLAIDPHTMYSKSIDHRRWEETIPLRYGKLRWNDVAQPRT